MRQIDRAGSVVVPFENDHRGLDSRGSCLGEALIGARVKFVRSSFLTSALRRSVVVVAVYHPSMWMAFWCPAVKEWDEESGLHK